MYHYLVRRLTRQSFARVAQGDYESALHGMAPTLEHRFAGQHAMGGTRHSIEGMRKWFQRLFRLTPQVRFTLHNVLVNGPPWNTRIAVEWTDEAVPADGSAYVNEGVHILTMRWGKVTSIHAYLDTQRTAALFDRLAAGGLAEAQAPPIEE